MPPRYSYWTILAGGLPTAFRAAEREELEPTFRRLREKHPDAEMKWFARGKLWASPEAARIERPFRDEARGAPRDRRESAPRPGEARGRDWRPGGEHRDPRQKFKDAKKARNLDRRQQKFARKHGADAWSDRPPREKPHGDPAGRRPAGPAGERRFDRPPGPPGFSRPQGPPKFARPQAPPGFTRPQGPPQRDWRKPPPRDKPQGDRFAPRDARGPRVDKPGGPPRNDWRTKDPRTKPRGNAPRPEGRRFSESSNRPDGPRPQGPDRRFDGLPGANARPRAPKGDWRARAPHERPHDDKRPPRDRRPDRPANPAREDWRNRAPRDKPRGDPAARGPRPFDRPQFPRNQDVREPRPPRPRGPNREPRPGEVVPPSPPPRPSEPAVPPPGPPERGHPPKRKAPRQR